MQVLRTSRRDKGDGFPGGDVGDSENGVKPIEMPIYI